MKFRILHTSKIYHNRSENLPHPTQKTGTLYSKKIRTQNTKGEIYYTVSINMFYIHLMGESGLKCKAEFACNLRDES